MLCDFLLPLIDPKIIVIDVFILFPHGLFGFIVNLNVHDRVINAITKFFFGGLAVDVEGLVLALSGDFIFDQLFGFRPYAFFFLQKVIYHRFVSFDVPFLFDV